MNIRPVVRAVLALAVAIWIQNATRAQGIPTNFSVGNFTYQFADPTTGQPITTLSIPAVGDTAQVAVYLLQQSGTPTNLFQQLGMEDLGVRLNYVSPPGVVMVPNTTGFNITARPPPAFNPNGNSSDYDFIFRFGSGTGTNTASSAAITEGLIGASDPLPFPGPEDPLGNVARMLIGTFTLQGLAVGTEQMSAVQPFGGISNLSGPNPQIIHSRNDGTTGPIAGNSNTNGEIAIDPLLSATIPNLFVTVATGVGTPGVSSWIGGNSGSWSNSGNWTAGVPQSALNTQLLFGTSSNATMTNDIPGVLTLNQLAFFSGAPAYTLNGNGLNFVTNSSGVLPQIVTNSTNPVTIGVAMTLTNSVTVTGTGNLTLNGLISGAGGLAKSGNGTLTLGNASNNFSGGLTLSAGTIAVSGVGALSTGGMTFDGGTFAYNGPSATISSPINTTNNGGTFAVTSSTASVTVTAGITGPGGLNFSGSGTLILAGTNSYTGATNVNAGTLVLATGATLGTGNLKVFARGTLAGNGTINGHTEIAAVGTIAPGIGNIGALNFTAPLVWDAGGTYAFGYAAVTGLNPGVNYSTITSSNTLDLSAITSSKVFTIAITSLTPQPSSVPATYTLASFNSGGPNGGITGFDASGFAFTGTFSGTPTLSLDATHNQLLLTFIPGPSTPYVWRGSDTNGNWDNAGNWSVAIPTSNINTQLTFSYASAISMTNDIPGTLILNQLVFNSGASAYTLNGNGLDFRTNSAGTLPQIVSNSVNSVAINVALTLTNNLTVSGTGNVSLNGAIGGPGSLTKTGSGTLTLLNSGNYFTGGTVIQNGTLAIASDAALGTGSVTMGSPFATLSYVSSTSTARSFNLAGATLAIANGAVVTLDGSTITSGYVRGAGTFSTNATSGALFANSTSIAPVTITSNSGLDLFLNFTNGGNLNVAANIPTATPVTLNSVINQGSGTITIGANSYVNANGFQSFGVLTLTPGSRVTGGAGFTFLANNGSSPLQFNAGSRTFVGSTTTSSTLAAGIDQAGQDIVVAGGLFVNNGAVYDSTSTGHTVIADYGALVKGAGFYMYAPITRNGGKYQAGNSPGVATMGQFIFGPGGVSNYVFAIDDATGQAGPAPDSTGRVNGWGLVKTAQWQIAGITTSGDFAWTANASNPLTVAIDTLTNATTAGNDVAGLMADFDPSQSYSWPAVQWTGNYSGPTDAATLDAATYFDTNEFANPIAGTFGWSFNGSSLSLDYTPSAVPEPGTLALVGLAAAGLWWRRRRFGC